MKPLKANTMIGQYAKDIGLPKEDVELMIKGYWQRLKKSYTTMEHIKVFIPYIGSMNTRYNKTVEDREHTRKFLEQTAALQDPHKYMIAKREWATAQLEMLDRIVEMKEQEFVKEKIARKKRKDYIQKKK